MIKQQIIAVGGMIGTGKSTFSKYLSNKMGYEYIPEYKEDDKLFKAMLQELYEGNERAVHPFQCYFAEFTYTRQKEAIGNIILDRHLIEHKIFADRNIKCNKKMSAYDAYYHNLLNDLESPDLYVILNVPSFSIIKERILKRGRSQEIDNFDKNEQYFKDLHESYSEQLICRCKINKNKIPYIIIDASDDDHMPISYEIITEELNRLRIA